tara:strand:+ start:18713 stop:19750 length:1038 start_codon:yes stop_codon:yes gene_type:complete
METQTQSENNTKPNLAPLSADDAADAILSRWEEDAEKPSEPEAEDKPEVETEETSDDTQVETEESDEVTEEPEDPEEETEETEEEDDETDEEDQKEILDDDAEVEVIVDGETVQASVKDLKRLYGQEASLTRKSQEVAKQRKDADDAISKSNVVLQKMLENAEKRFKPYKDVDMLVASKAMSAEDFAQLRKEAKEAEEDYKFLNEEADAFYKEISNQNNLRMQEAAKECVSTLQATVPDWNNNLYNDIRSYAISQGLAENEVNQYVDPNVIKILNKARLYDKGKKVATVKKKKVNSVKTLKSKKAPSNANSMKSQRIKEASVALAKSQSKDLDDISDVLLKRWEA